jgi:CRP-like cAMP-binding protein
VLNDGRRQIGAFYLPGDVFGLEVGDEHTFSAEAIVNSKVLVIKRSALVNLAARDNETARKLWTMTAGELQRVQAHILLLIKTAQERVAGFLLEMSERVPMGNEIDLPMSRQDIADYLGLTIETVSRTLTQLENTAAIAVPSSRRIVLRNRAALNRLNA